MDSGFQEAMQLRADSVAEEEWGIRLKLAAFYRLVDWFEWTELIFNHITIIRFFNWQ